MFISTIKITLIISIKEKSSSTILDGDSRLINQFKNMTILTIKLLTIDDFLCFFHSIPIFSFSYVATCSNIGIIDFVEYPRTTPAAAWIKTRNARIKKYVDIEISRKNIIENMSGNVISKIPFVTSICLTRIIFISAASKIYLPTFFHLQSILSLLYYINDMPRIVSVPGTRTIWNIYNCAGARHPNRGTQTTAPYAIGLRQFSKYLTKQGNLLNSFFRSR